MKILLLNTSDARGGAAVAAMRLMETLQEAGAEVRMLVLNRNTTNPDIMALHSGRCGKTADKYRFLAERLHIYMCNGRDRSRLFHVRRLLSGMMSAVTRGYAGQMSSICTGSIRDSFH